MPKRSPVTPIDPQPDPYIELPVAAQTTGADYHELWIAVLRREIKAERRGRRWYVERDSLMSHPLVRQVSAA
jgi:hypothetical protein